MFDYKAFEMFFSELRTVLSVIRSVRYLIRDFLRRIRSNMVVAPQVLKDRIMFREPKQAQAGSIRLLFRNLVIFKPRMRSL